MGKSFSTISLSLILLFLIFNLVGAAQDKSPIKLFHFGSWGNEKPEVTFILLMARFT